MTTEIEEQWAALVEIWVYVPRDVEERASCSCTGVMGDGWLFAYVRHHCTNYDDLRAGLGGLAYLKICQRVADAIVEQMPDLSDVAGCWYRRKAAEYHMVLDLVEWSADD